MNKIEEMLNLPKVREMIDNCPENETVILIPHWSINRPKYSPVELERGDQEYDMEELEYTLGQTLYVTDFDDLVVDPHGILEC